MKLPVDMNLSPRWIVLLTTSGFEALHWSTVGQANARDTEIMAWAAANGYVVLTHDLDFSAILAATVKGWLRDPLMLWASLAPT